MDSSVTFPRDITPELSNPHFTTIFKTCILLSHLLFHSRHKLGLVRGWYSSTSLLVTQTLGARAPSACLPMTLTWVVPSNTLEGRDAIQRDLDRLERRANANLIKFNKPECKVLHLAQSNPRHTHRWGREAIESSPVDKDLRLVVDEKLNTGHQQCALAAQKDKCIPGYIQRRVASRFKEMILHLHSALVRPTWSHQMCTVLVFPT